MMSDVKETSYTISVDNAVQMELDKCVECCADMSSWSGDGPDICNTCYEETKVHLPIPPTCLNLGMYMNNDLKSLCYPKGELKFAGTSFYGHHFGGPPIYNLSPTIYPSFYLPPCQGLGQQ